MAAVEFSGPPWLTLDKTERQPVSEKFQGQITVAIKAVPSAVWKALTDPEMIQQYLFGTQVTTDWKVGSPITYRGVWQGKAYEDKGTIVEIVPGKSLVSTYWSGMSGKADLPENYMKVAYTLEPTPEGTQLTLTQGNIPTEKERDHSLQNWGMVLNALKKLLEP